MNNTLTNKQAAQFVRQRFGRTISEATIRQWQFRGKLAAVSDGYRTQIAAQDLRRVIAGQTT